MNKTRQQTHEFFQAFGEKNLKKNREVVFCVPFTDMAIAREYADELGFTVGAQNFYPAKNGAFTGEISAEMLSEIGTKVVLVGHSERRAIFGETDAFINQKTSYGLENGLTVCLCIGETLEERENGTTNAVLKNQLDIALKDIEVKTEGTLVVAYEPVWAIGTGKVATLEQIAETHKFVRETLDTMYPDTKIAILYGGSANEKNATEILSIENVDGVLVGGASLDADKFAQVINA